MKRAHRALWMPLALALAGCVTSAAEEPKVLMSAWGDCVAAAVERMDDGKTDPMSIAYGVAPQCAPQYQRAAEADIRTLITENGQRAQRQLWRDKEVQLITSAVLIHRQKGRPARP